MAELDKLGSIPFLMEINMASNPLARKQLYRANVIRRLPTLKFVDGREVTYEERERIELMFVTDTRAMPHSLFYVDNQQHAKHQGNMQMGYAQLGQQLGHQGNSTSVTTNGMGGPRVPVKLTSVNFEPDWIRTEWECACSCCKRLQPGCGYCFSWRQSSTHGRPPTKRVKSYSSDQRWKHR